LKTTYTEEAIADIVEAITYLNERNPTAAKPQRAHPQPFVLLSGAVRLGLHFVLDLPL
jgi:hypothetical protein